MWNTDDIKTFWEQSNLISFLIIYPFSLFLFSFFPFYFHSFNLACRNPSCTHSIPGQRPVYVPYKLWCFSTLNSMGGGTVARCTHCSDVNWLQLWLLNTWDSSWVKLSSFNTINHVMIKVSYHDNDKDAVWRLEGIHRCQPGEGRRRRGWLNWEALNIQTQGRQLGNTQTHIHV